MPSECPRRRFFNESSKKTTASAGTPKALRTDSKASRSGWKRRSQSSGGCNDRLETDLARISQEIGPEDALEMTLYSESNQSL
jgi:hypothetical protein